MVIQDPTPLGFPSWIPSSLTTMEEADLPDLESWTLLEVFSFSYLGFY